ncbi:hypothetical protein ACQJBY_024241 [Aegilops geniculata]
MVEVVGAVGRLCTGAAAVRATQHAAVGALADRATVEAVGAAGRLCTGAAAVRAAQPATCRGTATDDEVTGIHRVAPCKARQLGDGAETAVAGLRWPWPVKAGDSYRAAARRDGDVNAMHLSDGRFVVVL